MKRRDFIAGLGSAAAWPLAARAQRATVPVIGYLGAGTAESTREVLAALRRGLSETGYVEGQNLAVEYRWAEQHNERLPALAADLVRQQVSVIVALQNTASTLAAKATSSTIPIVFSMGSDPVKIGLVASISRPGGNVTGISNLIDAVAAKRLELLHELVPAATSIAFLVNPTNSAFAEIETGELQIAARSLGLRLVILNASDQSDFEPAFAAIERERAGGLVVGGDVLFLNYLNQLIALAARYRVPAIYARREHIAAGGLMGYGSDFPDMYRRAGVYVGRILNGDKPADLPVQQVTKVELGINMKTAKALGLTFPLTLLGRADEVIE